MIKTILSVLSLFVMLSCSMTGKKDIKQQPGMCAKLPMAADGIVRLSKIEVYPEYLEEYMKYATEVGEVSLRTEPGDRKSTRLNSSHRSQSRMPSSA